MRGLLRKGGNGVAAKKVCVIDASGRRHCGRPVRPARSNPAAKKRGTSCAATAPADALRAYELGRALNEAVVALGGNLATYANTSPEELARRARRGDAPWAEKTLRGFALRQDADPSAALAALRAAANVLPRGDVEDAFWQHGARGWEPPRYVSAWRYGDLPPDGRSYNYRDQHTEPGVSVAGVVGGPEGFGQWQRDRPKRWVCGWWREDRVGSDGEPLLVGAVAASSSSPASPAKRRASGSSDATG